MSAITFSNITKSFGKLTANDDISFAINNNSVHCILGENGAGKSTLMKILFGIYKHDSGKIFIKDNEVNFHSPLDAIDANIGMLHQHFMLIDDFTILENVILGKEITNKKGIDYKNAENVLNTFIEKYHLDLILNKKVKDLSVSQQQKIELLKLLYRNSEILILDEPTAVLSPVEVNEFFKIIVKFKSEGKTILLITHKLNEVKEISDKVTILRKGKMVFETDKKNMDIKTLSREIIGDIDLSEKQKLYKNEIEKKEVCSFDDVSFIKSNVQVLNTFNIKLNKGEIYGICGVEGNGQNEIVDIISGIEKKYTGNLNINTDKISLVPDDRLKKGMISEYSIGENIILKDYCKFFITQKNINKIAEEIINKYNIYLPDVSSSLKSLSGGNQQKVIIARELELDNDILVFYHPTRGVDFNASMYIHSEIIDQRNKGKAILLISSDMDEILILCDRIGVLNKGKILKEFDNEEIVLNDETKRTALLEEIGSLMIGF